MTGRRALLLCAAALAATACNPSLQSQSNPTADGTDACDPVQTVAIQSGQHLLGDQDPPVPYSSTPPTSGWHRSGAPDVSVREPDDPMSEPEQVSVLEIGAVVVTYRDISEADRQQIVDVVAEGFTRRVAVTSYDKLEPGEVAMTGWGVLQRCAELDVEALRNFIRSYSDEQPAAPPGQD